MLTKRPKMIPEGFLLLVLLCIAAAMPAGQASAFPQQASYRLSVFLVKVPEDCLPGRNGIILSREEAGHIMEANTPHEIIPVEPDDVFRAGSLRLQGILRMSALDAESGTITCSSGDGDAFFHATGTIPLHTPFLLPNQTEDGASSVVTCLLLGLAAIDEEAGAEWGDS